MSLALPLSTRGVELPGSGKGTTFFPLALSMRSVELLVAGDEMVDPLFGLVSSVFASNQTFVCFLN